MIQKTNKNILVVILTIFAVCCFFSACSEKTNSEVNDDNNNVQVESAIIDILNNTKVNSSFAPTIGNMVVKVFNTYTITWVPIDNSESQFKVSISGEYNPNPDIPNLSQNGTITYSVDINTKECYLTSDPNNLESTFLIYIVNDY